MRCRHGHHVTAGIYIPGCGLSLWLPASGWVDLLAARCRIYRFALVGSAPGRCPPGSGRRWSSCSASLTSHIAIPSRSHSADRACDSDKERPCSCPASYEVFQPYRIWSVPIIEGHADLLGGTCDVCRQTVVGLDVGGGRPVPWVAVYLVVQRAHRLRELPQSDRSLATVAQHPEPAPLLVADALRQATVTFHPHSPTNGSGRPTPKAISELRNRQFLAITSPPNGRTLCPCLANRRPNTSSPG